MKTPLVSQQRPEDENLGIGANVAYGLQPVLTLYGGIVAVPLIIGQAAGLSAADIGLLIAASLFAGGAGDIVADPRLAVFRLSAAAGDGHRDHHDCSGDRGFRGTPLSSPARCESDEYRQ
jgi:hypothetical protein